MSNNAVDPKPADDELWGVLNAVRVALKFNQPEVLENLMELKPRIEEVLGKHTVTNLPDNISLATTAAVAVPTLEMYMALKEEMGLFATGDGQFIITTEELGYYAEDISREDDCRRLFDHEKFAWDIYRAIKGKAVEVNFYVK